MNADPAPTILVASYNVLADAHIRPEYYPRCDNNDLAREVRYPKLVDRTVELDADVLCLQEVDRELYRAIDSRLTPLGYAGWWAQKRKGKVEGCATFVRRPWNLSAVHIWSYADRIGEGETSGHIVLACAIERDGWELAVANTHLKWDSPETPAAEQVGLIQAHELVVNLSGYPFPMVICGDFNARPESPHLELLRAAGFTDAHPSSVATCAANGRASKIDYILCSPAFTGHALLSPQVTSITSLPSRTEPSDHVPIRTLLRWAQ